MNNINRNGLSQFFTDCLDLIKFKILIFSLITILIGVVCSGVSFSDFGYDRIFFLILGSFFIYSAAAALNHALEVQTDFLMERTKNRPIVSKRFNFYWVVSLSVISAFIGFFILYIYVNSVVALLSLFILISYDFIYTPLKKMTWLNTFVGAFPGAMPILCGWYASTYDTNLLTYLLFALFYFWQLPHFFSIAWLSKDAYKNAGLKMISANDTLGSRTSMVTLVTAIIFIVVNLSIFILGFEGLIYFLFMVISNGFFFKFSLDFFRSPSNVTAKKVMLMSLIYPILIFVLVFF